MDRLKDRLARVGILWGVVGFVSLLFCGISWLSMLALNGSHHSVSHWWKYSLLQRQLFAGNGTGTLYVILLVMLALTLVAFFIDSDGYGSGYSNDAVSSAVALVTGLAMVFSTVQIVRGINDNAKDEGRTYASATQFVVEDIDKAPSSMQRLLTNALDGTGDCEKRGNHDVYSCVATGSFSSDWSPRVASATGASYVIKRTTGAIQNTNVMGETLTYLYSSETEGVWTAVRDGKNRQPLDGIVEWDGKSQTVQGCRYQGKYAITRAFDGKWGNNLRDLLAKRHPGLFYQDSDIWGYCDGDEPIVVVPVTRQESFSQRTTLRAAGVLTIQGSESGNAITRVRSSVKPGELPGPVYPLSLVAKQRDMVQWAAGEKIRNRNKFGYEPTDSTSQLGNASEFLLKSKTDGRLYWVSPLKPRSSDSQQFVAYSVTPADSVDNGKLNTQKVYVLPDNDTRIVNIDDMAARVGDVVRTVNPGFFTGSEEEKGRIVEFLPISATKWQAFGELRGRVKYRIEVPTDARIQPQVIDLDAGTAPAPTTPPTPGTPSTASPCGKPAAELTQPELATCLAQLAAELQRRTTQGGGK